MKKIFWSIISTLIITINSHGQTAYPGWLHNAVISLNSTPTGADLPGTATLNNFPVLIKLEKGNFNFTQTKTNGEDIRFSTSGNVPLNYQIELWDATLGKSIVWVKVPSIQGNASQTIYIYWGKSDAISESNGANVFETTNGYTGVWHLDEIPNTVLNNYLDATGNAAHGTAANLTDESKAWGILGRATFFDRFKQQQITVSQEPLFDYTTSMSASFWMKTSDITGGVQFVTSKSNNAKLNITNQGTNFDFGFNGPKGAGNSWAHLNIPVGANGITDGKWHHVSMVFEGGVSLKGYFDGVLAGELTDVIESIGLNNSPLYIGGSGYSSWPDWSFDGILDEVRYSSSKWDANWIKLNFENQKIDQGFASAPKENGCTQNFGVVSANVSGDEGTPITVSGNANCADRYHWVEVDSVGTESLLDGGLNVVRTFYRITGDSVLTWRLKALYGASWQTSDVTVTIKDIIPNPQYSMISSLPQGQTWNGRDLIEIKPVITNKSEILALTPPAGGKPYNEINFNWDISGAPVYKIYTDSSVFLHRAYLSGTSSVKLCLDNHGEVICQTFLTTVQLPNISPQSPLPGAPNKLKVFVLAGQSNMEGHGLVYQPSSVNFTQQNGTLPWLLADPIYGDSFKPLVGANDIPNVYDDTWIYYPRMAGDTAIGSLTPMYGVRDTVGGHWTIGPEYGIGLQLGNHFQEQVLLIKTAWGGHSLVQKFRPPGAGGVIGPSYLNMIDIVKDVTSNLSTYFPSYNNNGFEIAGLAWNQGFNDGLNAEATAKYTENFAALIDDIRTEWNTPRLPVVIAETGNTCQNNGDGDLCRAQKAILQYPDFQGNVSFVPTHQFFQNNLSPWPNQYGSHWQGSFWSYYKIGESMGNAMIGLLGGATKIGNQKINLQNKLLINADRELIKLIFPWTGDYKITITNLNGKSFGAYFIEQKKSAVFSRNKLSKGIYFIRVNSANFNENQKLVLLN